MSLPPTVVLAGLDIYQQVLEIEPSGPSIASINSSNGVHLTLGSR